MTSWHVIIFGTLHQAGAMGVFINDVTLFWTQKLYFEVKTDFFLTFILINFLVQTLNLKKL